MVVQGSDVGNADFLLCVSYTVFAPAELCSYHHVTLQAHMTTEPPTLHKAPSHAPHCARILLD